MQNVILQPIEVGGQTFKNRIMFPPLTTGYEKNGMISEQDMGFYTRLAKGGVGYIVMGDVAPINSFSPTPKLFDDSQIPAFKALADSVHAYGTKLERLYRLVNGKAEALEFIPKGTDPYIGIPLRKLNIRRGTLVAVIVRQGKVIVPFGNDHIEAGDRVVVIACESGISDLNEVIRK